MKNNKLNENSLPREKSIEQLKKLQKTIDSSGGDIEKKVRTTSKTKEFNIPNTIYMDNPITSGRKISTYENFSKSESNKSIKPRQKGKMCNFGQFKCESVDNSLNESSSTDFIRQYGDELYKSLKNIKNMSKIYNKINDFDFIEIDKKMRSYDDNVGHMIENWIENRQVDIDEIVRFAISNYIEYGTEPQFVLFAIEDWVNILDKYMEKDKEDINESKDEEIYLSPKQRKLPEGLKKGIIDRNKKNGKKFGEKDDKECKDDKKCNDNSKKDDIKSKKSGSDEEKYLTPKQRKLPEGLKKGIIERAKKKSKVTESKNNYHINNWIQELDTDVKGTMDDKLRPMFVNRPNKEIRPSYDVLRAGKYITVDGQDCQIIGLKNGELLVDFINKDNKHEVKKITIKDALKSFHKSKK